VPLPSPPFGAADQVLTTNAGATALEWRDLGALNGFMTISVLGQVDVVAGANALTLVMGGNVVIETDAAADSVTIKATPTKNASTFTASSDIWQGSLQFWDATNSGPNALDDGQFGSSPYLKVVTGTTSGYVDGLQAASYHVLIDDSTMTSGTHVIDFSRSDVMQFNNGLTTGGLTFTTLNPFNGRKCSLLLRGGTSAFPVTFPAAWKWLSTMPATLGIGKVGRLTVEVWGSPGAGYEYVAAYKEEI
jgi:hypothetical protein